MNSAAETTYGKLTILSKPPYKSRDNVLVRCECGVEKTVRYSNLKSGTTVSCGCHIRQKTKERSVTHGLTKTPLYVAWADMKNRCYNSNVESYPRYGGRGITVCAEWKDSFEAFRDYALANGWEKGLQIDRFPNNDGNYEPSNVRFTTPANNVRNSTSTTLTLQDIADIKLLHGNGKTQTDIAKIYGVCKQTINNIIHSKTWM